MLNEKASTKNETSTDRTDSRKRLEPTGCDERSEADNQEGRNKQTETEREDTDTKRTNSREGRTQMRQEIKRNCNYVRTLFQILHPNSLNIEKRRIEEQASKRSFIPQSTVKKWIHIYILFDTILR